jgi:hypothetical protein
VVYLDSVNAKRSLGRILLGKYIGMNNLMENFMGEGHFYRG